MTFLKNSLWAHAAQVKCHGSSKALVLYVAVKQLQAYHKQFKKVYSVTCAYSNKDLYYRSDTSEGEQANSMSM